MFLYRDRFLGGEESENHSLAPQACIASETRSHGERHAPPAVENFHGGLTPRRSPRTPVTHHPTSV